MIGATTEIGVVTIGSDENGGITLNGAITTDGAVTIDGPVTLATGAVSVTTANDAITFNHKIDGPQTLTLVSGTAATAIQGTIGGTNAISSLTITNGTANGTIEIANIEGVTGATAIGNTNTTTITLDGTAYSTDGTQTYTAAAGQNIDITGVATFTTSNDNISFATSGVDLANNGTTTINTGTAGGTVSFGAAIEGNSASAPFNDLLVITSGTGNVTFTGAIGATNALGGLTVNSSQGNAAITFTSTIGDTGNAGVVGTTAIGNTTTTDLNFNGCLLYTSPSPRDIPLSRMPSSA